jgi:DNA polymerase
LDTEIALVRPQAILCLGATAAQALLEEAFKVTEHRGELVDVPLAPIVLATVLATVHPSSLLRARGHAAP